MRLLQGSIKGRKQDSFFGKKEVGIKNGERVNSSKNGSKSEDKNEYNERFEVSERNDH